MNYYEELQLKNQKEREKSYARGVDTVLQAQDGDPWAQKMVGYAHRCAHINGGIGDATYSCINTYRQLHPELEEQRHSRDWNFKREKHIRRMLKCKNPLRTDTHPESVYENLKNKYGIEYASMWRETYQEEKNKADVKGYTVRLHPEGSIIIKKGNNKR